MSLPPLRLLSKAILRPSERQRGRPSDDGVLGVRFVGLTSVPFGPKVQMSKLPDRLLEQAMTPLMPGKAAGAGLASATTSVPRRVMAPSARVTRVLTVR